MSDVLKWYMYDPEKPTPLVPVGEALTKLAPDASDKSGEKEAGDGGSTIDGVKVARRILPASEWLELAVQSVTHTGCCDAKAEDTVGGAFRFADDLGEALVDELTALVNKAQVELVECARDNEQFGWCAFELLPRRGGGLAAINHLPAPSCWISTDRERVMHTYTMHAATNYPLYTSALSGERAVAWAINRRHYGNTYYGVSDAWNVFSQIEAAYEAVRWNRRLFKTRGGYRWLMAIKYTGKGMPNEVADTKLLEAISAHVRDNQRSQSDMLTVPIGDRDITMFKLDADPEKLQWGELMAMMKADIQNAHRVPDAVLGGVQQTGALGGDVAEAAQAIYNAQVIIPKQRRWAALLNDVLERYYGVPVGFEWGTGEAEVDLNKLAAPVVLAWKAGLLKAGQAQALLGIDADPEYEELYYYDLLTAFGVDASGIGGNVPGMDGAGGQ